MLRYVSVKKSGKGRKKYKIEVAAFRALSCGKAIGKKRGAALKVVGQGGQNEHCAASTSHNLHADVMSFVIGYSTIGAGRAVVRNPRSQQGY